MIKCFLLRTIFKPELGKSQHIKILLNSGNELPTANSIEEIKNKLWQDIEIGNIFYEDENTKCIYINLPEKTIESLSQDWNFVPFSDLRADNCPDYSFIIAGIKKAGYSISL